MFKFRMFRLSAATLAATILSLVAASAVGQVTVTQQPASDVRVKVAAPPAAWSCAPAPSITLTPNGVEWRGLLLPGTYTVTATYNDGMILGHRVVVAGTPGPGPGPNPDPNPNPNPGPGPQQDPQPQSQPTPTEISAAIVCSPAGLAGENAAQTSARVSRDVMDYMQKQGYFFRQYVGAPLDETGKTPASAGFFTVTAANAGKYPTLIIGKPGSNEPLYAAPVVDLPTTLAMVQKFGGKPKVEPTIKPFIDVGTIKVDVAAPAGVKMGLIPIRTIEPIKLRSVEASGIADIPESQWVTWYKANPPRGVDSWVWKVKNQGQLGSCAAQTAAQAVQVAEAMAGLPPTELCAEALYSLVAYPRDSGSGLDENAETVEQVGIPEVSFSKKFDGLGGWSNPASWPAGWRDSAARHKCKVADLSGKTVNDSWHNLIVALLRGIPCAIGVDWPGGHSILAVAPVFTGQDATGVLIVNSWGADWNGDGRTVRSKSNVVNGIKSFGGPFAYVVPTFASVAAKDVKPETEPALPAPMGASVLSGQSGRGQCVNGQCWGLAP